MIDVAVITHLLATYGGLDVPSNNVWLRSQIVQSKSFDLSAGVFAGIDAAVSEASTVPHFDPTIYNNNLTIALDATAQMALDNDLSDQQKNNLAALQPRSQVYQPIQWTSY